jgi:hypothetical protein
MSKSNKIIYGVLAFAVLALALNTPGIIEGRKQKKAVDATYAAYSNALVAGDYASAFQFCGDEFKRSVPFEAFTEKQYAIQAGLGKLKAAENKGTFVHGKGSPMEWTAVIETRLLYEKGDLHLVCELHLENGNWKVYGCKQV